MVLRRILTILVVCLTLAPSIASATRCRDWKRMSEAKKWDRIDRMINDAISGQQGRAYQVDRAAIGRFLDSHAQDMSWDLEDLCSEGRTASMTAIRGRFKSYIWTCVN